MWATNLLKELLVHATHTWSCKIKPRCHMAFTTLHHIFEAIMLTWANQCNYFKNTLLSSKRMCSCELQLGLNGASSNVLERHTVTTFNWKRHPKTSHMAMESSPLSLVTFNCKRHSLNITQYISKNVTFEKDKDPKPLSISWADSLLTSRMFCRMTSRHF